MVGRGEMAVSGNADRGGIVSAKEGIRRDDAMGADMNWRG